MPTTPTTVIQGSWARRCPPARKRLPSGSSPGPVGAGQGFVDHRHERLAGDVGRPTSGRRDLADAAWSRNSPAWPARKSASGVSAASVVGCPSKTSASIFSSPLSGRLEIIAAAVTPGRARSSLQQRAREGRLVASSGTWSAGGRPARRGPRRRGSRDRRRSGASKLRIRRPAPTTRSTATAVSSTTRRRARAPAARRAGAGPGAVAQRLGEVRPGHLESRRQAGEHAGQQGHARG